jgi:ADP-dependent NAD(P)H-hydrate dehydratase / NAD(P)H-hydrate epimerase
MKIFPARLIPEIDGYTIENEPILPVDLMERAAHKLFQSLKDTFFHQPFLILAGPGNNGGDALALSRMLLLEGFEVVTLLLRRDNLSIDTALNLERLRHMGQARIEIWEETGCLPTLPSNGVVIDGLFGTGLNRPLEGNALTLVQAVNQLKQVVVSIDLPSGLMGEDNGGNNRDGIVCASYTYTFQFPKLAFLFPENQDYVGKWDVLDIELHKKKIDDLLTDWYLTGPSEVGDILPRRKAFAHKGNMGHVLLIAGSYGKMGAAVLASRACLRSGSGLVTVQVPHATCNTIHAAVPEALVSIDRSDLMFTEFPNLATFSAIGVGPAIGLRSNCTKALAELFDQVGSTPIVIDADAITIMAQQPTILNKLPQGAVLTPHPREFERLVGKWDHDYERMKKAIDFCQQRKVILVLKGAYTMVVNPEGACHFNTTGNPGMATAGSGDVLTGIILALLGKGIPPQDAAIAGVYLHGLAGDLACRQEGEESMIASDIIANLGAAFKKLKQ